VASTSQFFTTAPSDRIAAPKKFAECREPSGLRTSPIDDEMINFVFIKDEAQRFDVQEQLKGFGLL
jgi:hypothetical protein